MRRICTLLLLIAGCAGGSDDTKPDATATLAALGGSGVQGTVTFTKIDDGKLRIVADVRGLKPGKHGVHVHEFGDCSAADGESAGGQPRGAPMKKTSIFLILALFATNACQTSKEKETLSAETSASKIQQVKEIPVSWQDQMNLLDSSLTDIYPLILSPQDFQRKDNQEFILSRLEVISEISKKVNHSPMSQMSDPSLNFISFDFRDQAELAKNSFEGGNKDFARFELLKTTQFCIECHTQSNRGPSFQSAKAIARFEKLNLLDQAEMLTATRKFDEALLKYKQFFGLKETLLHARRGHCPAAVAPRLLWHRPQ